MRDMPIPSFFPGRVSTAWLRTTSGSTACAAPTTRRMAASSRGWSALPAEALEAVPSEGGWSAAQIGWHVAAVDTAFADLISGQRPSQPLAADFQERDWSDVVALDPSTTRSVAQCDAPAWCATRRSVVGARGRRHQDDVRAPGSDRRTRRRLRHLASIWSARSTSIRSATGPSRTRSGTTRKRRSCSGCDLASPICAYGRESLPDGPECRNCPREPLKP